MGDTRVRFKCAKAVRLGAARAVHVRHRFPVSAHVRRRLGKTPSFSYCQVDVYESRARFKYAIRAIKQRENALRRESLAKKMTSNSNCAFWKEIKKMNNVNTPLPNCIAGVSGGSNISELRREQFSELLNCISDTTDGIDCHCCYTDEMMVSVNEVNECISRLECNKAYGLDCVSAEHLKHCSSRITPLLAMCITGFMVHVFVYLNR